MNILNFNKTRKYFTKIFIIEYSYDFKKITL